MSSRSQFAIVTHTSAKSYCIPRLFAQRKGARAADVEAVVIDNGTGMVKVSWKEIEWSA